MIRSVQTGYYLNQEYQPEYQNAQSYLLRVV